MYWYVKYPLIAVFALAVLGCGWLMFREPAEPTTKTKPDVSNSIGALYTPDQPKSPAPPIPVAKVEPVALPATEATPEVKPVVTEIKPPVVVPPEVKPTGSEVKPPVIVDPEVKPAVPDVKPPVVDMKPGDPVTPFGKQLQQAMTLADNGEYLKAREILDQLLADPTIKLFDPRWTVASEKLSALNTVFISTDLRCPEKIPCTVKSGDVLIRLAHNNGTTVEQLTKNNPSLQRPKAVIQPGQNLYILKGNWKLVAYRSKYRLLVYNGDKLFKVYPIAIGKEGRTPQGAFLIEDKVKEPPFRGIPYSGNGEAGNPLGTRWMRLKPIEDTPADLAGYGIHGTWNPDSLGKAASNGCLRMLNSDVEELFDFLPMKAETVRVEIKE